MKIKNLIYIPYHDWRKINTEGNRTRDAHFIEKFRSDDNIQTLIILNRPLTIAELILKKKTFNRKIKGKVIFKSGNSFLYKIDKKTYIIDVFLNESIEQILNGRKWFFKAYGNSDFKRFYAQCLKKLNIIEAPVITANIFSNNFFSNNDKYSGVIFDAWDNFFLIPNMKPIKKELLKAYQSFSTISKIWVTNSIENKTFYKTKFGVKETKVIRNGVDFKTFSNNLPIPNDLKKIKNKIIIGFAGKITHLFDYNLFNYITQNKSYNFVIIGQILNKKVFSRIKLNNNVYYLGDKKYEIYPNYLSNFDIGIIPYKVGKDQHGGDTIKVYEYLAAGLPVIGTRGNGLQDMGEFIYLADSIESFNEAIKHAKILKKLPEKKHSWESKKIELLSLLN